MTRRETTAGGALRVAGLRVEVRTDQGWTCVVDGVDLEVRAGETLGVVGESGAGKSIMAMSIARLLPDRVARVTGGSVLLDDLDLVGLSDRRMRSVQGGEIGVIFQEPRRSLDPSFTVGDQIAEGVRAHAKVSKRDAWTRAVDMLDRVGIPDPARRAKEYPHTFSGGMCQRVMLAVALASEPRFLIADEPTTALDVTVQAQVLDLLKDLQSELGLGILFITHDLGVIAEISDRVTVLYAGQVVESGTTTSVLHTPTHPYTAALLAGIPDVTARSATLQPIPGRPPLLGEWPQGCRFNPRCAHVEPECTDRPIELREAVPAHETRCRRVDELVLKGATW